MNKFYFVAICLGALSLFLPFLGFSPLNAQNRPNPNTLVRVSTSLGTDYTRMVFTFQNPLDYYVVRRIDVNQLLVDFGPVNLDGRPTITPNDLLNSVEFTSNNGRLNAVINLNTMRYELRHFASRDRFSAIIDIRTIQSPHITIDDLSGPFKALELPSLPEVARQANLLALLTLDDSPEERIFQRIINDIADWELESAKDHVSMFKRLYPQHRLNEIITYLEGELLWAIGPWEDVYPDATASWGEATARWPDSPMSNRAKFMLAEADRLMGYQNEAAAKFKILATDAVSPDDIYGQLALLRAADLLLSMGQIEQARELLAPTLDAEQAHRLNLEAQARLGLADFYEGLYSQANENFREILRQVPQLYTGIPEMLYAMGE
ncbi:MAG: tetratricopeptide repeat protein, partial [Candidatus Adiutrix sp.]